MLHNATATIKSSCFSSNSLFYIHSGPHTSHPVQTVSIFRPQATLTCFPSAKFCSFVIHPVLFCTFFSRCGNVYSPSLRHSSIHPSIHSSLRRVFRPGTKFCYALTSIDSQSECITELGPGTHSIHCPILPARSRMEMMMKRKMYV